MVDLKKEIKLSDLFRRKAKDPEAAAEANAEKPAKPAKERKPLFARKEKAPKDPKQPKESRRRKEPRAKKVKEKAVVEPKSAPELPAIPLMRAFNLMPTEEVRQKSSRLGLAQVLVALLGLLLVAGLGSAYIFMSARAGDRQSQVDDLRGQLADLEVPAETPDKPGDTGLVSEGQARTTSLAGALQGRVAWDRILREVSLVLPEEVYLTQVLATTVAPAGVATVPAPVNPNAAPNSLTLEGGAATQALVARFLARLQVIPEFATVDLQSSAYQEQADVYVFSIAATIAPEGAS